ncbi:hypothetical protein IWX49DRAFT_106838 [Phyllosticta citricarpa]
MRPAQPFGKLTQHSLSLARSLAGSTPASSSRLRNTCVPSADSELVHVSIRVLRRDAQTIPTFHRQVPFSHLCLCTGTPAVQRSATSPSGLTASHRHALALYSSSEYPRSCVFGYPVWPWLPPPACQPPAAAAAAAVAHSAQAPIRVLLLVVPPSSLLESWCQWLRHTRLRFLPPSNFWETLNTPFPLMEKSGASYEGLSHPTIHFLQLLSFGSHAATCDDNQPPPPSSHAPLGRRLALAFAPTIECAVPKSNQPSARGASNIAQAKRRAESHREAPDSASAERRRRMLILVLRHQLRQEGFSALLCVAARWRGAGLTESWSWPPAFCANAFLMAVVVVVVAAALARATWLAWCVTAWHGGVSRVDCRARGRSRGGWWVPELRLHSLSIEALDLREPCSIVNG